MATSIVTTGRFLVDILKKKKKFTWNNLKDNLEQVDNYNWRKANIEKGFDQDCSRGGGDLIDQNHFFKVLRAVSYSQIC